MTPYRPVPIRAALLLALPVGLFVWRHATARPGETWACVPLLAVYLYGLVATCVNRVWVRVTEEGVASGIGPMPCGPRPSWMPRAEIRAVYVRRARVKFGHYQAAGVERRDGLCIDLTAPFSPNEDVESAAFEISRALRWTEPVLRQDEGALVQHESKATASLGLWMVLQVAAVAWAVR